VAKRKKNKNHVYEREQAQYKEAKRFLKRMEEEEGLNTEEYKVEYEKLLDHYGLLLQDSRLITSVSDRLQNKLNRANDKITEQNEQLQETINMLLKARVGRKATTIVLAFAVVLFLLSEGVIEPQIEKMVGREDFIVGLMLKGAIALILKPAEIILEKNMTRKAMHEEVAAPTTP
jgi:hypothetical protein